jgi:serine protease Do
MKSSVAVRLSAIVLLLIGLSSVSLAAQQRGSDLPRSLLMAFRDVISEPAKSTVQIYADGYRTALGAIVRSDGHIVTKASELKGKIECQLSTESQKRPATIVARDSTTDLAILKIDATNLPVVPWSTSDMPPVGSWLATPGPVSRDPLTIGVVSVAARKLPPNAAMGVRLDDTAVDFARIAAVVPGLAAEKAGLKDGDIIRRLDADPIKGMLQLQEAIRSHYPGDKVSLLIERQGKQQTIEVTLGTLTDMLPRDERSEFQNTLGGSLSERRTGFPLAIQHDSVLRPVECGGPIVDLEGKVVGVNIARAGRVESYALPASIVRDTVDKLLKTELTSTTAEEKPAGRKNER